jgi:hypothetical protein
VVFGVVRLVHMFHWPVRVRALLTVLLLVAAIGLRATIDRFLPGQGAAYLVAPSLVVDVNTAPASVLGALPHVGPSLVNKLVEQREIRPFESIDDLRRRVRGFGPSTIARLAPHLRIGPSRRLAADDQPPRIAAVPDPPKRSHGPLEVDMR